MKDIRGEPVARDAANVISFFGGPSTLARMKTSFVLLAMTVLLTAPSVRAEEGKVLTIDIGEVEVNIPNSGRIPPGGRSERGV